MSTGRHHLGKDERPLTGIARLLRERLRHIDDLCAHGGAKDLDDEKIHALRKASKASRALWRLLKETVDALAFEQFDQHMRATARRFASTRERSVRRATFDQLLETNPQNRSILDPVRRLLFTADTPLPNLATKTPAESNFLEPMVVAPPEAKALHDELPELYLRPQGQRKTLVRALKRQYKRTQRAFECSLRAPNDAELLHALRKQVKYHKDQLAALRGSTELRKRSKRLGLLAETLGAHHDFADLERNLRDAASTGPTTLSLDAVLELLSKQQETLAIRALKLCRSLFKRSPRRMMKWLVRRSASLR